MRRFGLVVLALLAIGAAFHRPILHGVIRFAATKAAATQHIQLGFQIEGSLFSNLVLKNLRAAGGAGSPVEKISVEEFRARYSLPGLLRHGVAGFLRSCELKNAEIVLKPVDEPDRQEDPDIGAIVGNIVLIPAIIGGRVNVEHFRLLVHTPDGDLRIQDANVLLDRAGAGFIKIEQVKIPNVPAWNAIAATAHYADRKLIVRDLNLDDDARFNTVELDASRHAENICRAAVDGRIFGGAVKLWFEGKDLGHKQANIQLSAAASYIGIDTLVHYFNPTVPMPAGNISDVKVEVSGDLNVPASWTGQATALGESMTIGASTVDRVEAKVIARNGTLHLESDAVAGNNKASLSVRSALPKQISDFARIELNGLFQIEASELSRFSPGIARGTVNADGKFGIHDRKFTLSINATAKETGDDKAAFGIVNAKLELAKAFGDDRGETSPFDDLETRIEAVFQEAQFGTFALDSGEILVTTKNERVRCERAGFKRAGNAIQVKGFLDLPRDLESWPGSTFDLTFFASAPSLASFNAEPNLTGLNGQLEAHGSMAGKNNDYDGRIVVSGSNLSYGEFKAEKLNVDVPVTQSVAKLEKLELAINATDGVTGSGRVELRPPFAYDGRLRAKVRNLAAFNALIETPIGGALDVDWEGSGKPGLIQHSGQGRVKLQKGRFGNLQSIDAEIAGLYSPEVIDFPIFRIDTNQSHLQALVSLRDRQLRVRDIKFQQEKTEVLTGEFALPLDLRTPTKPETILPLDGPVSVNLTTKELRLETLPTRPAQPLPLKGKFTASLTAQGSMNRLEAHLAMEGRELQARAAPKLSPATLDLDLHLRDNRLALTGDVKQPGISPIEITGTLPFPVTQILAEKKIDDQLPVRLSVKLPKSSVALVSQIVPDVRYIEGQMSLDANMDGTLAKPLLSGAAQFDLPAVRFRRTDAPAINSFKGDLKFSGDQLAVNRFEGGLAGGTFDLAGKIGLTKITEPQFDLRITSRGALLVRNETLTVRADSDVKINGPFDAANVTGTIGITKSKFFREVEILPITLPGRPAPRPPQTSAGFSFPKPPLRDWKFDVVIKTKDPFLIRGNLANGAAEVDLRLIGTGRAPALDGKVQIENFTASLPFSKLKVAYGYVYFSPDDPFVPTLDIRGTSRMRDYNINVSIFGTASEPQTIFTSEPPLPQEEILSLLATGATTQELTGRNDVLAGRAAVLLFQKLYRKVFKSKPAPENESFLSRFNVDIGGVDSRTGKQEASAQFELFENFYLIGDLDVEGRHRGAVKYLLRFR